jgi:hypothetical protein
MGDIEALESQLGHIARIRSDETAETKKNSRTAENFVALFEAPHHNTTHEYAIVLRQLIFLLGHTN